MLEHSFEEVGQGAVFGVGLIDDALHARFGRPSGIFVRLPVPETLHASGLTASRLEAAEPTFSQAHGLLSSTLIASNTISRESVLALD